MGTQQAIRSYTWANTYFVGTFYINAPASMQVGDIMVFTGVGDSVARGFDTLYGWTQIHNLKPSNAFQHQVFIKEANINDIQSGVSYGWGTDHYSMAAILYAIANATPQLDQHSLGSYWSGNDALIKAIPITLSGPEMLIWFASFNIDNGTDVRVPPSIPAYAYNHNGGGAGAGHQIFGMSTGIALHPGGYTGTNYTDAQLYVAHATAAVSLLSFRTRFTTPEIGNPLHQCEA